MSCAVYYLVDPRWPAMARYVGQSTDPSRRHVGHCLDDGETHKARWIRKVRNETGEWPTLQVIAWLCDSDEAKRVEVALIALWRRRIGDRLTNATAGGDGLSGYRWSDEQRLAASHARKGRTPWMKGKNHSETSKAKISAAGLGRLSPQKGKPGRPHTTDERARMSAMYSGHGNPFAGSQHSDDTRGKMKAAWIRRKARGWKPSESTKQRVSKTMAGRKRGPASEETRRTLSMSHHGQVAWNKGLRGQSTHSEATRAAMRRSQRRRRMNELFVRAAQAQPQLARSMMTLSRSILTAQL